MNWICRLVQERKSLSSRTLTAPQEEVLDCAGSLSWDSLVLFQDGSLHDILATFQGADLDAADMNTSARAVSGGLEMVLYWRIKGGPALPGSLA